MGGPEDKKGIQYILEMKSAEKRGRSFVSDWP